MDFLARTERAEVRGRAERHPGDGGKATSSGGDAAPPSLAISNVTVVCSPTSIPETTSPGFGTSCGAGAFSVTVSVSLVVAPSALKIRSRRDR